MRFRHELGQVDQRRRTKMRRTLALIAVAAISLIAAGPAGAQANPYSGTTTGLAATDTTPPAGGQFTVSGTGCDPGADVDAYVDGAAAGSTTADGSGAFSASITAPTAPGTYTVNAVCGATVLGVVITVGGAAAADPGTLPVTGGDSISLVQIGVLLLAVGALAVVAVRTRRPARARVDA
jgi:hypothetical protein